MKLELKYLAPYLPYNIKFCSISRSNIILQHGTMHLNSGLFGNISHILTSDKYKILLHNLSDINKEIEVNGEKFIPFNKLSKKLFEKEPENFDDLNSCRIWLEYHLRCIDIKKGYDNLIHWIYQDLIKWHFDLFELIENNLAIDINNLNN